MKVCLWMCMKTNVEKFNISGLCRSVSNHRTYRFPQNMSMKSKGVVRRGEPAGSTGRARRGTLPRCARRAASVGGRSGRNSSRNSAASAHKPHATKGMGSRKGRSGTGNLSRFIGAPPVMVMARTPMDRGRSAMTHALRRGGSGSDFRTPVESLGLLRPETLPRQRAGRPRNKLPRLAIMYLKQNWLDV
jgi:hypothetical protein